MNKSPLSSLLSATTAVALGAFVAVPAFAADSSGMGKPAGSVSASASVTATVTKIDKKDRWVTLKLTDGTVLDVQAGPEVKNFAQIHVGDQVTAQRDATMTIAVLAGGQAPPNVSGGTSTVTAAPGAKPMAVQVDTTMVSGRVTAVDAAKRTVTIKGPAGNSHTVQAGPDVAKFDAIKVGDDVLVTVKSATVIEVTAPAKKAAKPKPAN
jgi:hypothetical protein